ncbi:hypothetical protein BBM55_15040 [Vibrio parahaemolyticus]|nr:hypothetical protein BBM55_15040 [Vibrio parahaemolyticus]
MSLIHNYNHNQSLGIAGQGLTRESGQKAEAKQFFGNYVSIKINELKIRWGILIVICQNINVLIKKQTKVKNTINII